ARRELETESGTQQRRLARAGRTDHDDEPAVVRGSPEPADQLLGTALAAEEPLAVGLPERRQASIGAYSFVRNRLPGPVVLALGRRSGAGRGGQRVPPQLLPGGEVVETVEDRLGAALACFTDEHLQHRRQAGEARGHVAATTPIADALRG